MRQNLYAALFSAVAVCAAFPLPAGAEPGVTADKIVFGQATALEGPAAALGQGMRTGILAAFGEANKEGGVKGRKLELISRDDGYDPNKSIAASRQLIDEDKVFALIGAVGTPTSAATQPIAAEGNVPFIAPFTGAEFLRTPFKPNVINIRASYFQEAETMVERLTKDRGVERIAVLYQDDAFGRAGLDGVQRALDKRGMKLAADGTYERNTVAVKGALLSIRKGNPQAVIIFGVYKSAAEFIRLARMMKMDAVFAAGSFVGTNALAKELGSAGDGVYVMQVVPFPGDASVPLVARYQAALKALDPAAEPGFVTLEGYIAGRLVIEALQKLDGEPSRQALLGRILSGPMELQGVKLHYGASDNHGGENVYITVISADGSIKPVDSMGGTGG
jgi:branched-chain amino acid transport system substrate-binding protein